MTDRGCADPHRASDGFPSVQGRCPCCGAPSLFLGAGGYVTCSRLDCSDPGAASDLLLERRIVR